MWENIIKQKKFEVRNYDPLYASRKNKIPYTVLRIFSSRTRQSNMLIRFIMMKKVCNFIQ